METIEVEKFVLGTLIFYSNVRDKIFLSSNENYFYWPRNRKIFETCKQLYNSGVKFDMAMVSAEVNIANAEIKAWEISELCTNYLTENIDFFLDKLRNNYIMRFYKDRLFYEMNIMFQEPDTTPETIETYLHDVLSKGTSISKDNKLHELDLSGTLKELETTDSPSIQTDFLQLDKHIGGLRNGNLIVLGGRTGHGKTAFSLNLAMNLLKSNYKVGMISLEMTQHEITSRLLAMNAELNLLDIFEKRLDEKEWDKIKNLAPDLEKTLNNLVIFDGDTTLDQTVYFIRSMVKKHGCKVVIIDYLGLITIPEVKHNPYLEIKTITRKLKLLAKELDVPILLLSQLNRSAAEGEKPHLAHLRDSGSIEQDADIVLFIYRDNVESPVADIIIAKGRNVKTGELKLKFFPEQTKFVE
jgi:replicative DNA helicase